MSDNPTAVAKGKVVEDKSISRVDVFHFHPRQPDRFVIAITSKVDNRTCGDYPDRSQTNKTDSFSRLWK